MKKNVIIDPIHQQVVLEPNSLVILIEIVGAPVVVVVEVAIADFQLHNNKNELIRSCVCVFNGC